MAGCINVRSSGIVDNLDEYIFHIMGCGAIGSSVALQLCKMGARYFILYDMDKVEELNVGVSIYNLEDVGKHKTDALCKHLKLNNPMADITTVKGKFKELYYQESNDIVILGFDNMAARLAAVTNITNHNIKPLAVIDGRMGAEHYQQYILPKPTLKEYLKSWYPDSDSDPEPCTMKATSYCSNMSGSFIVNAVRKLITNQPYDKKLSFNFPTMILGK